MCVCEGNVRQSEEKFCGAISCTVASHFGNRCSDLASDLYVHVPSTSKNEKMVLYKVPFVPAEKLDIEVLSSLVKERCLPSEWFEELSVLTSGGKDKKADEGG